VTTNTTLREHARNRHQAVAVVGRFLEHTMLVPAFFTTAVVTVWAGAYLQCTRSYITMKCMSQVMSIRVPDDAYEQLEAIARQHGIRVSTHASNVLTESLDRDEPRLDVDLSSQATVPEQLTTVERHTLATLHRILARLVPADEGLDEDHARDLDWALAGDGTQSDQIRAATIFEHGWVGEYHAPFTRLQTELPRRDSGLVLDILDMFRFLGTSVTALSAEDRDRLGESTLRHLEFSGFDANDSYEGALLSYAQDLIKRGKWSMLADHFSKDRDEGNSHFPHVAAYRRMLDVFTPIWQEKLRGSSMSPGALDLSREELARVAAASIHPSRR
jgi:uncharacterized protein YfbU (UPF0304 family)